MSLRKKRTLFRVETTCPRENLHLPIENEKQLRNIVNKQCTHNCGKCQYLYARAQGLWRLPVKLLLPTKSELGGCLDRDEKDVFAVNAKAL